MFFICCVFPLDRLFIVFGIFEEFPKAKNNYAKQVREVGREETLRVPDVWLYIKSVH